MSNFSPFSRQGNPFVESDMFNLVTLAVIPDSVCKNIENRDKLGREALEKFVYSDGGKNQSTFGMLKRRTAGLTSRM